MMYWEKLNSPHKLNRNEMGKRLLAVMLKHIKKISQVIIRVAQKILVTIFLTILYIIGFGATFIFICIFKRNFLFRNCKNDSTFWREATGYEPDPDGSLRQA